MTNKERLEMVEIRQTGFGRLVIGFLNKTKDEFTESRELTKKEIMDICMMCGMTLEEQYNIESYSKKDFNIEFKKK